MSDDRRLIELRTRSEEYAVAQLSGDPRDPEIDVFYETITSDLWRARQRSKDRRGGTSVVRRVTPDDAWEVMS